MRVAGPKYQFLTPLIRQEPNTTENIDKQVLASSVEGQQIHRILGDGSSNVTMDRSLFGMDRPDLANPSRPTGSFEVIALPIPGAQSPKLYVGPFVLTAGRDYEVGVGLDDTASNIADAISNIPGYDAVAADEVVTVQGPAGHVDLPFRADYQGVIATFEFTYVGKLEELGYLSSPLVSPSLS